MPDRYARQILEARNVGLSMTRLQADAYRRLLEQYAEELAVRVASGYARSGEREALRVAREILAQLNRDLARATRNGVVITAERVGEIYSRATLGLIDRSGAGINVGAMFQGVPARAAQAVLSRPELSAAFVTIRRDSVATVDELIQRAALRGAHPTQLGHELRLFVVGSEAFSPEALLDRRRIGYRVLREMGYEPTPENLELVRRQAGKIDARAQLIARTEIVGAYHEAHVQSAAVSPIVRAIRWSLSHRHPKTDVCFREGTLVTTARGQVPIERIQVGELVLTHAGRFRPVTRLYRNTNQGGRLLRLRIRGERSRLHEAVLTPNHPVLTDRGWTAAGGLRTGDRGFVLPEWPPSLVDRPFGDTEHTARPGSAESASARHTGRASAPRHGEHQNPGSRRPRSAHRDAGAPIGPHRSESAACPPAGHLPNSDYRALDVQWRGEPETLRASSIHRNTVDPRGWGSSPRSWPSTDGATSTECCSTAGLDGRRPGRTWCRIPGTRALRSMWRVGPDSSDWSRIGDHWQPGRAGPQTADRRRGTGASFLLSVCGQHTCESNAFAGESFDLPSPLPSRATAPSRTPHIPPLAPLVCAELWMARQIYPMGEVVSIDDVETCAAEAVFNLQVEEDHTYIAGGVVVHNCDLLADVDWYGMGAGLYDPRRVPARPHPRCLCVLTDILIDDPVEFGQARGPLPPRKADVSEVIELYELPPSQERMAARALELGERVREQERQEAAA